MAITKFLSVRYLLLLYEINVIKVIKQRKVQNNSTADHVIKIKLN